MDLPAEYYLQTVDLVFVKHALPKGEMTHRGQKVDPGKIRRVALMTVEGENDDISGLGQTKAALTIATNLPASEKKHLVADAGHYGIFNGSKWRNQIAPVLEEWITTHGG
jgi:poly(3-hydroxybutyrate) depolymerase